MKAHIFYAEDDQSLSFVTRDNLELKGYKLTCSDSGAKAREILREKNFDLCILDVMLPEVDGFTLAKEIRRRDPHVPIIFLTAKSMKEDKLRGLRLGADDYITKPFSIEELILKVEVFLRRSRNVAHAPASVFQIGEYEFDYENFTLRSGNKDWRLTQREAELLRLLAERKNQVLKRAEILKEIWGEDDYFMGRSLDVFVSRLRKYLNEGNVEIENIHGVGFRLKG